MLLEPLPTTSTPSSGHCAGPALAFFLSCRTRPILGVACLVHGTQAAVIDSRFCFKHSSENRSNASADSVTLSPLKPGLGYYETAYFWTLSSLKLPNYIWYICFNFDSASLDAFALEGGAVVDHEAVVLVPKFGVLVAWTSCPHEGPVANLFAAISSANDRYIKKILVGRENLGINHKGFFLCVIYP